MTSNMINSFFIVIDLSVVFDLEDVVVADIEIGLGVTEKMARDNVNALTKRGIIEPIGRPPRAKYVVNLDNISELSGNLP